MFFGTLRTFLSKLPEHTGLYVGYSGGIDSHVLLDALCVLNYPVTALHINHQLSPQAKFWEKHCERICSAYNVPLLTRTVNLTTAPGISLEAAARDARYAAYATMMPKNSILFLAHHQNDQAETLLLQLLRGAGVQGLAAMPTLKREGEVWIARPLLTISRKEIEAYAEDNHLEWITDESNFDEQRTRNHLRHSVIPLLEERWPSVIKTLSRSAELIAENIDLQAEIAEEDISHCKGKQPETLHIKKLKTFSSARRHNVLRYFIKKRAGSYPNSMLLRQIDRQILEARPDAMPLMACMDHELRRYQGELYCIKKQEQFNPKVVIPWDLTTEITLPTGQVLMPLENLPGEQPGKFSIQFRQKGERLFFHGQTRSLKKILQELKTPPWERERLPLLYCDQTLVGIFCFEKWVFFGAPV